VQVFPGRVGEIDSILAGLNSGLWAGSQKCRTMGSQEQFPLSQRSSCSTRCVASFNGAYLIQLAPCHSPGASSLAPSRHAASCCLAIMIVSSTRLLSESSELHSPSIRAAAPLLHVRRRRRLAMKYTPLHDRGLSSRSTAHLLFHLRILPQYKASLGCCCMLHVTVPNTRPHRRNK
jgi:hypothetical protein